MDSTDSTETRALNANRFREAQLIWHGAGSMSAQRRAAKTIEIGQLAIFSAVVFLSVSPQCLAARAGHIDPGGPACETVGVRCEAGGGLIRDSALALTEAVWVGPEARGVYVSPLQ